MHLLMPISQRTCETMGAGERSSIIRALASKFLGHFDSLMFYNHLMTPWCFSKDVREFKVVR